MSRGATARLFVGVDPPAHVREQLAAWALGAAAGVGSRVADDGARALRLLEPETLHLTLCFLGNRPVHEIEAIGSTLSAWDTDLGELSVGAPLWLPPRRPHALAVEIRDRAGGLTRLHETVTRAISQATAWEPERRRFRAHITVARMRERARRGRGRAGADPRLPATPQLSFTPESVVLYRSWLSRSGAAYEAIATCHLIPAEL
jgi:RNA 2',3'-cyclic 3'-phosphodiesterase